MATAVATKGLEGIVAANSGICWIDGDAGVLAYRGIDIHDLAEKSTFEETTYLLWHGKLPTKTELDEFSKKLVASRTLPPAILDLLKSFPKTATPMEVLRTAVSALSFYDKDEKAVDHDSNIRKSFDLTAQIPMLVAAFDRIRKGKDVVTPDASLSHAGNFLYLLNGEKPSETATRAFDVALILHADHELNASTFAARVIAATLSDVHSAITGAIGALKGPQKKKVSGFGHRVYHTEDPRATHLRKMSKDLGRSANKAKWFEMSQAIEVFVKNEKKLNANVDFYSASTYTTLGIDIDLFTPIFAVSRIAGWAAHVIEQLDDNRLIRPRADYIGPEYPAEYVPVEKRA
jgi:citrate synthase